MSKANKYTILVNAVLSEDSLSKIKSELAGVKILPVVDQVMISDKATDKMVEKIKKALSNLEVSIKPSVSGTGSKDGSPEKVATARFGDMTGNTFTTDTTAAAGSARLLAGEWDRVVTAVNRATEGARANVSVTSNAHGEVTKVIGSYTDMEGNLKRITLLRNKDNELELSSMRHTENKAAIYKKQLATLEKLKKAQSELNNLIAGMPAGSPGRTDAMGVQSETASLIKDAEAGLSGRKILDSKTIQKIKEQEAATRDQIKVTKEYNEALKEQLDILERHERLAERNLADMRTRGQRITEVRDATEANNKLLQNTMELKEQVQQGNLVTEDAIQANMGLAKSADLAKVELGSLGKNTLSFTKQMGIAIERTFTWASAMTLFYGAIRQLKEGIDFISALDKSMTEIGVVTGQTTRELAEMARGFNQVAKELGTTTQSVAQGSLEFIRQGKTVAETNELIRVSTMQAMLANMSAAQSTEYLTSIMNGFQLEASDMMGVLDKLIDLDNRFATSVGEIAVAMQRSSNSARIAGVSLDLLASMITVVSSTTRQSAESIGESFKTIFARLQSISIGKDIDEFGEDISNVETVLRNHGIALRDTQHQFRDFGDIMDDIHAKWQDLGSVQQSEIAGAIAGVRQRERFLVLMNEWNQVKEAELITTQSAGLAQERYGIYLESVEAKMNRFKATWEEMWIKTINSDSIKGVISLGTAILGLVNKMGGLQKALGLVLGVITVIKKETIAIAIADTWNKLGAGIAKVLPKFAEVFAKATMNIAATKAETAATHELTNALNTAGDAGLAAGGKITTGMTQAAAATQGAKVAAQGAGGAAGTLTAGAASLSKVLGVVGIAVSAASIAFSIYNGIKEAHRKRVEEATQALDNYLDRVESIPSKMKTASESIDEINDLLKKHSEEGWTTEDEEKFYRLSSILHELIPEYDGWRMSAKGWYLEQALSIEEVNKLLEKQKELNGEELDSFMISAREKSKEYNESSKQLEEALYKLKVYNKAMALAVEYSGMEPMLVYQKMLATYNILKDLIEKGFATEDDMALYDALTRIFGVDNVEHFKVAVEDGLEETKDFIQGELDRLGKEVAKSDTSELTDGFLELWTRAGDEARKELLKTGDPFYGVLENMRLEASRKAPGATKEPDNYLIGFREQLEAISRLLESEARDAFDALASQLISLRAQFEEGNVSATAFFDVLTERATNRALADMFDDSQEAAEAFFVTLLTAGVEAMNSLNEEFKKGDINILEYLDGLSGANDMIEAQYEYLLENSEALGLNSEQIESLTSQYEYAKEALGAVNEEFINMRETADLLRQGYDSVMSGDMFAQFQDGAENALAYYEALANAAYEYAQASGFAFEDSTGKALNSAEEIYNYLSGSIGNFSNFSTQMTAKVNEGLAAQQEAVSAVVTELANLISTFKISMSAHQEGYTTFKFKLPAILGGVEFPIEIPNIVIDAESSIGDTSALSGAIGNLISAGRSSGAPFTNDIWRGGGGYTPPSTPGESGGGGGGGRGANDEARRQEEERKNAEKAYQDLLKMTIDMLKHRAKEAIRALKEEVNAYKELIDKKKDLIDQEKRQRDLDKDKEKREKAIADLQAEIAESMFDDSEAGVARRLELEEQLYEKQEELADFNYDNSVDARKRALDQMYEDFKTSKEKEIEALEEYLRREGEIVQEALELIEGRTQEFYDQLMEWNMTYGSGIAQDVIDAWKGAIEWIDVWKSGAIEAITAVAAAGGAGAGSMDRMGSSMRNLGDETRKTAEAIEKFNKAVRGGGGYMLPIGRDVRMEYHDGGIVGGAPTLQDTEVFAKLLKGEVVVTQGQAANFMRNTLPNIVNESNNTGNFTFNIPIQVHGDVDKNTVKMIRTGVFDSVSDALIKAGIKSSANTFGIG